jgi:hypothetical protein
MSPSPVTVDTSDDTLSVPIQSPSTDTSESAYTSKPKPLELYLGFDLKPYETVDRGLGTGAEYSTRPTVKMGGKTYSNAIILSDFRGLFIGHVTYAAFNLEGKYRSMRGYYGHVDGASNNSFTMQFICDGKSAKEITMQYRDFGVPFEEIDLTDVQVLELYGETNASREYALIIELIPMSILESDSQATSTFLPVSVLSEGTSLF